MATTLERVRELLALVRPYEWKRWGQDERSRHTVVKMPDGNGGMQNVLAANAWAHGEEIAELVVAAVNVLPALLDREPAVERAVAEAEVRNLADHIRTHREAFEFFLAMDPPPCTRSGGCRHLSVSTQMCDGCRYGHHVRLASAALLRSSGMLARITPALRGTPPSAAGASEHTDRNCCCAVHMGPTDACPQCPAHGAPTPPPGPALGALVEAAQALKADLLARAKWDDDVKVVCAGAGAWFAFCTALDAVAALPPTEATPR